MRIQAPSNARQAAMLRTWEAHLAAEFEAHDVEAAMATMTAAPRVIHIGTMTGGFGAAALRRFYRESFLFAHPPDTQVTPVGRVIGDTTIVDQLVYACTHTIEMPWLLPGVPVTGKPIAVPMVVIVEFEGDKIDAERIYFDQASILAQLGLLDASRLPIVAGEPAALLGGAEVAPNALIDRASTRTV